MTKYMYILIFALSTLIPSKRILIRHPRELKSDPGSDGLTTVKAEKLADFRKKSQSHRVDTLHSNK